MNAEESRKKANDYHHEAGYKTLLIGQVLSGGTTSVSKATYASCLSAFSPNALIGLFLEQKIVVNIRILSDFPIDACRNRFIEEAIAAGTDYVFMMDMDQTFPTDAIKNLFEIISDEKPIVSGMYFLKKEPYNPVMGRYVDWGEDMIQYRALYEKLGFVHKDGRQLSMWRAFTYWDDTVPFQADVIGLGCVLMKTSVFKDLKAPFFRYTQDPRPESRHHTMDEVMHICAQWKKLNVPIFIDPRVQCGHIMQMESNRELYVACRDSRFESDAKNFPKKFDELTKKFIDVRGEQRNGSRIPEQTPVA